MDTSKAGIVIIAAIISAYFVFSGGNSGGNINNNTNDNTNNSKTVYLNVTQYLNDGDYNVDDKTHEFHNDYKSLNAGDILVVRGNIVQRPKYRGYVDEVGTDITTITIASGGKDSWPIVIYVGGNAENGYKIGDAVEVTLHIGYYNIYQEWNNETWHVYGEFPEESIKDGKYGGGYILVSRTQVAIV